jgi:hypothetical protein
MRMWSGTRASFFLPLFSETLAQAGLLAKACKTTQASSRAVMRERWPAHHAAGRSRRVLGQGPRPVFLRSGVGFSQLPARSCRRAEVALNPPSSPCKTEYALLWILVQQRCEV